MNLLPTLPFANIPFEGRYTLANDNLQQKPRIRSRAFNNPRFFPLELKSYERFSESKIELTPERVTVRKFIDGLQQEERIAIESYAGVVIAPLENQIFAIKLKHHDEKHTLTLMESDEWAAVADWRLWGQLLNLPLMIEHDDGGVTQPYTHLGAIQVSPMQAHRRGIFAIYHRRSRNTSRKQFPPLAKMDCVI